MLFNPKKDLSDSLGYVVEGVNSSDFCSRENVVINNIYLFIQTTNCKSVHTKQWWEKLFRTDKGKQIIFRAKFKKKNY